MKQVILQHIQKVQDLRLLAYQSQHDNAVGILKLGVLIELIQDHVGVGVLAELDVDPHTLAAGLVADVGDAVDTFFFYQLGNLLDEPGLIDHIGKLGNHDVALAVAHGLDVRHGTHADLAAACPVGFLDASGSQNLRACGEIRSLDDL